MTTDARKPADLSDYNIVPETITPEQFGASYQRAIDGDDATLKWLLDGIAQERPELRAMRDDVADHCLRMKAARDRLIGRKEGTLP